MRPTLIDPRTIPDLPAEAVENLRIRDEIMNTIQRLCAEQIETLKRKYGFEDPHPTLTAIRARPPNRQALIDMTREYNEYKDFVVEAYGRVLDTLPPEPVIFANSPDQLDDKK